MDQLLHHASRARIDGDYRRADQLLREAIMGARPGSAESSSAYRDLAGLRVEQLRPREALALLARSEWAAKLQGSPAGLVAPIRVTEASALADSGRYEESVCAITEASGIYARGGCDDRLARLAMCRVNLVSILLDAGRPELAADRYVEVDRGIRAHLSPRGIRLWEWLLGHIIAAAGWHRAALRVYGRLLEDPAVAADLPQVSGWLLSLAESYAALGRVEDVCRTAEQMRTLYAALEVPEGVLAATVVLAEAAQPGIAPEALSALIAAVRTAARG